MHRHGASIFQGCIRISMNEFFSNMALNYLYCVISFLLNIIVLPIFFISLSNYNSLMKNYVLTLVFIDNTYFGLELDFCYNFTQTLVWNCILFSVYFYQNSKKVIHLVHSKFCKRWCLCYLIFDSNICYAEICISYKFHHLFFEIPEWWILLEIHKNVHASDGWFLRICS